MGTGWDWLVQRQPRRGQRGQRGLFFFIFARRHGTNRDPTPPHTPNGPKTNLTPNLNPSLKRGTSPFRTTPLPYPLPPPQLVPCVFMKAQRERSLLWGASTCQEWMEDESQGGGGGGGKVEGGGVRYGSPAPRVVCGPATPGQVTLRRHRSGTDWPDTSGSVLSDPSPLPSLHV